MKRLVIALLFAWVFSIMNAQVESIITCPGEDCSTQVNVSWAALEPGTCVEYAPAAWPEALSYARPSCDHLCFTFDNISSKRPNGENFIETPVFIKCGATLSGLNPGTDYLYRIIREDGTPASEVYSFRTAPAAGQEWSCCIISDFHNYPPLPGRQRAAMDMLGQVENYDSSIDWVLHLGDVCAWGGSWSFWVDLYKHPYFSKYMWAGLNGNHDNMSRGYDKCTSDFFRDANYVPRNGYEGQEGVCYHFRYGDAMFVMLNNEVMRDSTGFDTAAQWLRKVVTEARSGKNAPRYVIVCEHYQWFYGTDGKTSQYGRWAPIFDELGIDLALSGNNHIYARTGALKGGVETDGTRGTVYVQTPSADNERGQAMNDTLTHNQDIIKYRFSEGGKTVGALSMKVDSKHIVLALLDRNGTVLDTVEVKAK